MPSHHQRLWEHGCLNGAPVQHMDIIPLARIGLLHFSLSGSLMMIYLLLRFRSPRSVLLENCSIVRGFEVVSSKSGDLENHYSMPDVTFTNAVQHSFQSEAALSISATLQPPQYSKTFCLKLA